MTALKKGASLCRYFISRTDGQMAPLVFTGLLIAYSLFMGTAIDMANLWLHKYRVMTAAEAGCSAGAADLAWVAQQGTSSAVSHYQSNSGGTGFPMTVASSGSSCVQASKIAMCAYAVANMPGAQGLNVAWPLSDVPPTPPTYNPNGTGGVSSFTLASNVPKTPPTTPNGVLPYLYVSVEETVPTYLLSVMPWFHSPVRVIGTCDCGMMLGAGGTQTTETVNIPSYMLVGSFGEQEYLALAMCAFPPATQTSCNNYSGVATAPEISLGAPTAVPVTATFSQVPGGGSTLMTGSFTGTVQGQVSCDGGHTWQTVQSDNFTNTAFSGYVRGTTTCTVTDTNQIEVRAGVSANGSAPRNGGNFTAFMYWGFYAGSIQITTGSPATFFAGVFQGS